MELSVALDITASSELSHRADLLEASLDDEVVLLSVERGSYYCLDDIGSDVWRLTAEPRRAGDVIAALTKIYEADEATIAADLFPLLREMAAEGLIDVG